MRKNKKINLLIIGNGHLKKEIKNFIREKKIKNIYLLDTVVNPFKYMKNAKLIVSSSLWEGLPNFIIESSLINSNILSLNSISGPEEIKNKGISLTIIKLNYLNQSQNIKKFSNVMSKIIKKNKNIKDIKKNIKIINQLNDRNISKLRKLIK